MDKIVSRYNPIIFDNAIIHLLGLHWSFMYCETNITIFLSSEYPDGTFRFTPSKGHRCHRQRRGLTPLKARPVWLVSSVRACLYCPNSVNITVRLCYLHWSASNSTGWARRRAWLYVADTAERTPSHHSAGGRRHSENPYHLRSCSLTLNRSWRAYILTRVTSLSAKSTK